MTKPSRSWNGSNHRPWHGLSDDAAAILGLGPGVFCARRAEKIKHDDAVRDADQMLWDKQTDEGPSALEKLRDKS